MRRYRFSLGNSSRGPVGYCAAILAETEEEAVAKLKAAIPLSGSVTPYGPGGGVEYIEVYFNESAITADHIEEVSDHD